VKTGDAPPLWPVEEGRLLCHAQQNGQKLSYIYYEDEPGRRSAAKLLSKDDARGISQAAGVAAIKAAASDPRIAHKSDAASLVFSSPASKRTCGP
jgi:hypothetical protein